MAYKLSSSCTCIGSGYFIFITHCLAFARASQQQPPPPCKQERRARAVPRGSLNRIYKYCCPGQLLIGRCCCSLSGSFCIRTSPGGAGRGEGRESHAFAAALLGMLFRLPAFVVSWIPSDGSFYFFLELVNRIFFCQAGPSLHASIARTAGLLMCKSQGLGQYTLPLKNLSWRCWAR